MEAEALGVIWTSGGDSLLLLPPPPPSYLVDLTYVYCSLSAVKNTFSGLLDTLYRSFPVMPKFLLCAGFLIQEAMRSSLSYDNIPRHHESGDDQPNKYQCNTVKNDGK